MPGVVLRVSRTRHDVPASASTQRRVWVATPHRRHRMLSDVRSTVSSEIVCARTVAMTSPFDTVAPSSRSSSTAEPTGSCDSRTAARTGTPARTPEPRTT